MHGCHMQEYEGQQLKQLIHALCPAIYGHELVKAGVILALFGGVRKGNDDLASVPVRGDIHCLIVGDPGIGKSQLLKAHIHSSMATVYQAYDIPSFVWPLTYQLGTSSLSADLPSPMYSHSNCEPNRTKISLGNLHRDPSGGMPVETE